MQNGVRRPPFPMKWGAGGVFNGGTVRKMRRRKRRAAGCARARGAEVAAAGRRSWVRRGPDLGCLQ